jgi:uncharacterized protein
MGRFVISYMPAFTGWLLRLVFAAWFAIALAFSAQSAEPNFPALTGPVVDAAGVLGGDATELEARLRAFEQSSGKQVAIATVPSLEGYEIRDYGNRLFRHWKLGDKERDDGVLILVAPNERKVSIEVGYRLEGDLTDAMSRIIIDHAMVPRFKTGDYAGGVAAGFEDIKKVIGGDGDQVVKRVQNQAAPTLADLLPFILLFIIIMFMLSRGSRGRRVIMLPGGIDMNDGFGGRGGGFGGSYGGGGFGGGFGGGGGGWSGGGGSSGGGGASGDW